MNKMNSRCRRSDTNIYNHDLDGNAADMIRMSHIVNRRRQNMQNAREITNMSPPQYDGSRYVYDTNVSNRNRLVEMLNEALFLSTTVSAHNLNEEGVHRSNDVATF